MTCHQTLWYLVPAAMAEAANPDFADLYIHHGRPAESPARLALVLFFQHIERLSDADAAEAVRARLDWKYALALELDDPGFDASILSDFRARLLAAGAEERLLTIVLDTLVDAKLLKERGRQRSDSTHVLGHVRTLSRLALVGETMRAALNDLADVAPDWLRAHLDPVWAKRYAVRVEEYRLPNATAHLAVRDGGALRHEARDLVDRL